jgi:hypothetical protein
MTRSLRPWIPAVLWAITIFVLSSLPGSAYPATNLVNADKLVHLALYGLLGALCARGFVHDGGRGLWSALALAALVSTGSATSSTRPSFRGATRTGETWSRMRSARSSEQP